MRQLLKKEIGARQRRLWIPLMLVAASAVLIGPVYSEDAATDDAGDQNVVTFPAPAATNQRPGQTLQDLISGQGYPLTLKLKDMNDNWRRVTVSGQLDLGSVVDMFSSVFGAAGANAYYTRGQTVTVGGETYLIAYHTQAKGLDFVALMRGGPEAGPPAPEKLTPDTIVSLSLLNLRTSGSLKDIRPFDLQREISSSGKATEVMEAARTTTVNSTSLSNLKQLGLGLLMYVEDYDQVLPPMKDAATMKKSLMPYVKSEQIFISPITKEPYRPNPILSGKNIQHITNPAAMVAIYEPSPAPDGTRGVGFLDGHAKRIKEAEWAGLKKASKIP